MLAEVDYPFLNLMWTILIIFFWIIWLMILFHVIADVFRRQDASGAKKTIWLIFVICAPFLGVLVYVIVNGTGMAERNMKQAADQQTAVRHVRQERCSVHRSGRADRKGQGPARQRRHHPGRVRRDQAEGARVSVRRDKEIR